MTILFKSAISFFFLLTPFFVLLLFLQICKNKDEKELHKIANKTTFYILSICLFILFFGQSIFNMLGITLVAFQIGSGIILLLSSIFSIFVNLKNTIIWYVPKIITRRFIWIY